MKNIRILALTLLTVTAVTTNLAHADTECASKKDLVAVAASAGSFNTLVAANTFVFSKTNPGAVAGLVGIECGVVSGVSNLESSGVEAPDWRPRHDEHYHDA